MTASLLGTGPAALVLVDLQPMTTALPTIHPMPGVLANASRLAAAFRAHGLPVVLVRVAFAADGADSLTARTDAPPPALEMTEASLRIDPAVGQQPSDLVITKRGWDAYFGTELDLQLRRRRVDTVVLGGVRTAIGVESTARTGFLLGYEQLFVTDAITDVDASAHDNSLRAILPRLGRRTTTESVVAALGQRSLVGPPLGSRR